MSIKKCKIDGIRKSELTEDDLLKIVDISKNISMFFDDEKYINFNYLKKSYETYIEPGFYPQDGSWEILGTTIEIKKYDTESFIELFKKAKYLLAKDIDTSNVGSCNELFEDSKVTWYTDYSSLISFLDGKGYVSAYISDNWLSVDGRRFKINTKAKDLIPLLKNYESFYEVDSLGTTLFIELTRFLEILYESIQKSLK